MKRKLTATLGLAMAVILAATYYYFEFVPEVDANPRNAPVEGMTSSAVIKKLPLTTKVSNPAGISFNYDTGTYLVSTDDQVFAEVSAAFDQVLFSMVIANSPLNLGDTEGVTYLGSGRAAVVGENGAVVLLTRDVKGQWSETERFAIQGFEEGTQLGSAAYSPDTGELFTAQKKGRDKVLYSIELESRAVKVTPLKLASTLAEKTERSWAEFYIAGLHFKDGELKAVSEAFSALLTIEPNGLVTAISGVTGLQESAGITFSNGHYYLIGDAEGYLPDPPIYILDTQ